MSETKLYNFRLPIELMERLRAAGGSESATAQVMEGLRSVLDARTAAPSLGERLKGIYFMRADEDGPVKIGWSENVRQRADEVRPTPDTRLTLIRLIDGPRWGERWLHGQFDDFRIQGEWFSFAPEMLTIELPAERPPTPPGKKSASSGTSKKTTTVGVRVPNGLLAEWQAAAESSGVLISPYVLRLARAGARYSDEPLEMTGDTPITAIFGDGERRAVGTGHEGGIVTAANAGTIILELQDQITGLTAQLGELTRKRLWQEADVILLDHATDRANTAERRVAELEAEVAGLRVSLLKKMPVGSFVVKPPSEVDLKTHHQSGPVLASAVPVVDGSTGWSGLKGSDKKGKRA